MTLAVQQRAVIQCDWETDDKKWGCVVTADLTEVGLMSRDLFRQTAIAHFKSLGWQIVPQTLCPRCVGRRTDTRARDDEDKLPDVKMADPKYAARYAHFMSINAKPADIARWLNKNAGRRTWTGSSKRRMAEIYAEQSNFNAPPAVPPAITDAAVFGLITQFGAKGKK